MTKFCHVKIVIVPSHVVDIHGLLSSYTLNGCILQTLVQFHTLPNVSTGCNVLLYTLNKVEYTSVVKHIQYLSLNKRFHSKCFILSENHSRQGNGHEEKMLIKQFPKRMPINIDGKVLRLKQRMRLEELNLQTLMMNAIISAPISLIFKALIQNVIATVLLDTGATHSFISRKFMDFNNINFQNISEQATVADGHSMKIYGKTKVHIAFDTFQSQVSLYVVDLNPVFDGILGMDWLSKYNAILDCAKCTCTIKKGKN